MAFDGRHLLGLLDQLDTDNSKGEYYLTDTVRLACAAGHSAAVVEGEEDELLGVNSREDLAVAEAVVQDELRARAMEDGATLVEPATVWFHHDTQLGRDVVVQPNVVFGPGVTVADNVQIKAFSHPGRGESGKRRCDRTLCATAPRRADWRGSPCRQFRGNQER